MGKGVLIGGSPSTGSSVLVNLLNRRSELLAGPETYLFSHSRLYTDWEKYRRFLIRTNPFGGLKSRGWFPINGAILGDPFYGWEKTDLRELTMKCGDFPEFADAFFARAMQKKGTDRWVEKSPSNALCLDIFLRHFPGGKVIHTTRNPYDTIASLVARGLSVFDATASFLVNTAFGLKPEGEGRHFRLRYEDWVRDPEKHLAALFSFLDLDWDPAVLEPSPEEEVSMEGWLNNEKGKLGSGSIGRFERMADHKKKQIRLAVQRVRIKDEYRLANGLPVGSIPEIGDLLGYAIQPAASGSKWSLLLQKLDDQRKRMVRLYPFAGRRYPVTLNSTR